MMRGQIIMMVEPEWAQEPGSAETLEDEIRRVKQELKVATEKQERLSTALEELESSGETISRKYARLEDSYDLARDTAKGLVAQLSELIQQLSNKRNRENEARELELKKQRFQLEQHAQKLAEPVYATALEWVQTTQPFKRPPPGPPDVLMPSDNTIPRIARRKEMRKIWRLLRKAATASRIPVSFLHGGPGAGKTFTAYHLMKKDPKDLAKLETNEPALYEFAQATKFLAISFNNSTPVHEGRESRWMAEFNPAAPEQKRSVFMPVTARLLYQFVDAQRDFPTFCDSLDKALSRGELDPLSLGLSEVIATIMPGFEGPLVLIVDELTKLKQRGNDKQLAENMRSALCGAMTPNFLMLFTSLSDGVMKNEAGSNRAVEAVSLAALPLDRCAARFMKELDNITLVDSNHRHEVNKQEISWSLARMCWGHPRSLEVLVSALRTASRNVRVDDLIRTAVEAIRANFPNVTRYPTTVLRLVLLGVDVDLTDVVEVKPGSREVMSWDDLIAAGYIVNSTAEPTFIPHISELVLRAIVAKFDNRLIPEEAKLLIEHLRLLLGVLGFNVEWRLFEKLNLYWELVHRDCTGMRPDVFRAISVKNYYKTTYAKGHLTETLIDVVEPLIGEKLFPDVLGVVVLPDPATPDLLLHVWYPGVENFPGLDSVHFVLKAGGAGILPLVFQHKFSADRPTTVLNRATVENAYEKTQTLMAAAGWTEFVFIACAWRSITQELLANPPENVMILTRDTLTKQFGCIGAVTRTVEMHDLILSPTHDDDDAADGDEQT